MDSTPWVWSHIPGRLDTVCQRPEKDDWKPIPGITQTLPCAPFPFAKFNLYPLTIINLKCDHKDFLNSYSK